MPATGYCTVDDLRAQLADTSSILDQALLDRAIAAASRAVDSYCARRFWRDGAVSPRRYAVDEPDQVWIDDVASQDGLVVATDENGDGVYETVWDPSDYQLNPLNADADGGAYAWWQVAAVDVRRFPVYDRRAGVQVTAEWGWSQVPDEVVEATVLKAASLFRRKDAPFGVAGFGEFGAVRITRQDPDVVALLDPLVKRRPRSLTYRPQRFSLFHSRLL